MDLILEQRLYDVFGEARPKDDGNPNNDPWMMKGITSHGFTGHEHLQSGLIHMNGRAYDPAIGRFLSVDPFIVMPENGQSINPYSYVMNNPLKYTDPSGYVAKEEQTKPACDKECMQEFEDNKPDICNQSGNQCAVDPSTGRYYLVVSNGAQKKKASGPSSNNGTIETSDGKVSTKDVVACVPACVGPLVQGTAAGQGATVVTAGALRATEQKSAMTQSEEMLNEAIDNLLGKQSDVASSPPPPDDEDESIEKKVKQFENIIDEPYHNTPPLRELVRANGKWKVRYGGKLHTAKGEYEYVVIKGRIWVGSPGTGHYHISHGARSVDYAGHIRFGTNSSSRGKIQWWNNNSGHYVPESKFAWQARLPIDKFVRHVSKKRY